MPQPKPDISEFEAINRRHHPTMCVVMRSASRLDERDRINFDEALARKDSTGEWVISHNAISEWLRSRGFAGRDDAIQKHRNGQCCCV